MKANGEDKSPTRVEISDQDGKVVLHFSRPTQHLVMEPENAFPIAEGMARAAHAARFPGERIPDGSYIGQQIKARLTEQLRDRMVVRAALMMRNLIERKQSPDYVARQLVDTIFAEVDQ